ncbi:asparaginase domain-containing protein [Fretibacter rubidus]|uniref:asparaginase domain-containing protein n=1 Tax=Fretibacter rubidus TaxID=570162 RepID=UPI00352AB5E9
MTMLILTTGGTLDKIHDTYTEGLVFGENSHMEELLRIGRSFMPRIENLMRLDSLDMTDNDREHILQAVLVAPETQIVITHGTGTMEQTAKFLSGRIGDKTVILTGSMRPFSLGKSDAGFNIGGAVIAAQTMPSGVYGVMNGRIFEASELRKDVKAGRFDG